MQDALTLAQNSAAEAVDISGTEAAYEQAAAHTTWLHEPKIWLAFAFITLFALFGKKIAVAIGKALDNRATKIAAEMQAAQALRLEAEALKASYQQKLQESVGEAEGIISEAREQAARLVANAETEIQDSLERRLQQMAERMQQQEQRALDEVRNHIVDITIAAAKALITEHFNTISSEQMVQQVMTDLDRKVH